MPRGAYDVMDLKALRCFFAVARRGSLTQAGIELGISEAAVSQRVKALETRLSAKLYEARGGRVRLTAAGERTAQIAVSVFGEIDVLEREVAGARETAETALASHDSVLRYLLPDKVEAFHRAHPLARLRLLARSIDETLRLVCANECDLGIVPQLRCPEELSFHPIATYPACLVLQKGHPLAHRAREDFQSLLSDRMAAHYPLIVLEVQREDSRLRRAFEHHQIPFNVSLEVSTVDTLKYYVARGLGVAVVAEFAVTQEDYARLDIIPIPAEFDAATTYGVVVRRGKHRSALLKSLIAVLTAIDRKL